MIALSVLLLSLLTLCQVGAGNEIFSQDELKGDEREGNLEEGVKPTQKSKDPFRRVWMLKDVGNAEDFINGASVSVIAFLKDLESDHADVLNEVLQSVKNLPFGICSNVTVWKEYNITNSTISLFRKFDEGRIDYELKDGEVDPSQVIQFLRQNEMRLVIEYNQLDATQIFGSGIPIHLLLLVSKKSSGYQAILKLFHDVAPEYRGKVIFVLVDTDVRENVRVISYFKVKEAELPAFCLFHVETEAVDVMKANNSSTEALRQFCNNFMEGKAKSPVKPPRPPSEEL
ncbi:endoplasmic reticulum resident protein 27 [Mustelus asterias]